MYLRVTGPKICLLDNNGVPAAGYYVFTLAAGTVSTLVTTVKDHAGTPNTNPIVLNARGEADILSSVALKLVFTLPGGTLASPIWTEDYVLEQQGTPPLLATLSSAMVHNLYVYTISPVALSLANNQMIVLTPDADNIDTLDYNNDGVQDKTFTGTGIDDATFSGPYTGNASGAIYSVEVDGAKYQPAGVPGLDDVVWGGTPLLGHVYTVKISTAAGTDKFQWRRDAGAWSAEINITGAAQALTDGATVKFGATTGHTLADLWNNVDTFKWKVDGGAYTAGVAITALAQTLVNGVKAAFAEKVGHTLGDIWTLQVERPAQLDFSGLGYKVIRKNIAGVMQALDGKDMKQNYIAVLCYSLSQDCYQLINPSLPVLTSIPRKIYRREVIADDTVSLTDSGNEISYIGVGGHTETLLPCSQTAGFVFDFFNSTDLNWTIRCDPAVATDRIMTPEAPAGVTSIVLGPGQRKACRLVSNGANYHMESDANYSNNFIKITKFDASGTWTKTAGYNWARVIVIGGGGGGGYAAGPGGGPGGGAGGYSEKVIDISAIASETVTVGLKGVGGVGGAATPATAGGASSFGAHATATGGGAAGPAGGTPGVGGVGSGGDINADGMAGGWITPTESGYGGSGPYGGGGIGLNAESDGNPGVGPGAAGGGAFSAGADKDGGDGADGLVVVMEYR